MSEDTEPGLVGLSDTHWRRRLAELHRQGRYEDLATVLAGLEAEIGREKLALAALQQAPWYHRYRQLARFHLTPAQRAELFDEMSAELRLKSHYERVVTEARLPKSLWKYLDMAGVPIAVDPTGLQYDGFGKYGGTGRAEHLEVVTFFARSSRQGAIPPVPAHFFSRWHPAKGRFIIDRAYRGALPRGSGSQVVAEQLMRATPPQDVRSLRLQNVVNGATYSALVREDDQGRNALIEGADFEGTPLGRFVQRILAEVELAPGQRRATLSALGHLHVDTEVTASES